MDEGDFIWALSLAVHTSSWLLLALVIYSDEDDKPGQLPFRHHPFKARLSEGGGEARKGPYVRSAECSWSSHVDNTSALLCCLSVCLASISEMICPQHNGARICPFRSDPLSGQPLHNGSPGQARRCKTCLHFSLFFQES